MKFRIFAVLILLFTAWLGYFMYQSHQNGTDFKYGLDLSGGSHLVYVADVSDVDGGEVDSAMDILRRTIERRINTLGVSEPIVQVEKGSVFSEGDSENRLIVELPGVTDLEEALRIIGDTPLLEFKLQKDNAEIENLTQTTSVNEEGELAVDFDINDLYQPAVLTGGDLKRANLVFDQVSGQPTILVEFNNEGAETFAQITKDNVGNVMGIFLDGEMLSSPVIRQEIVGGTAQITGQFNAEEARDLVNNLNFGALPVPIELNSSQSIDASLGENALNQGINALIIAIGLIFIYTILFYRISGLVASISLVSYLIIMLALFKFIPVVLTTPGIAGLILSIGMTVDGNILIAERLKEELDAGRSLKEGIIAGFKRAWPSIRDGNTSSLIAAVILYWFSDTAIIKGFALVFALGVLASMLSAFVFSRTYLLAISKENLGSFGRFIYSKGITNIVKNESHFAKVTRDKQRTVNKN